MATGAVPVRIRTAISLFVENSHLETRHQGVMFRSPRAFVGSTATLRYEPCTQFINVSQRALHIYFIDGCRVCPLDARYKNRTKQPLVLASSHRGIPFYFCMARNSQVNISSSRTAAGSRAWGRAPVFQPAYRTSARIWTGD